MGAKLGRNKPCWCGSGKKYKRCHLGRENEDPVTIQEILEKQKEVWGKEYCLHPQASHHTCQGQIVQAHTIQRSGVLDRIAQNGQVYTFQPDYSAFPHTWQLKACLVGVRKKASTFTGFCAHHDNSTFEPIENQPFQFTMEQIFLLAYRAVCREIFAKRAQVGMQPFQRTLDRGKTLQEQEVIQDLLTQLHNPAVQGQKDIEHHKGLYDTALVNKDFSDVHYYAIQFQDTPDIMCSGARLFDVDFEGSQLQCLDQMDKNLDGFSFSLVGINNGGAAIISWLGNSAVGTAFIRSLDAIPGNKVSHAIVRLAFGSFENTFFSPHWWDGLTTKARERIQERVSFAVGLWDPDYLKDDGLRLVNWRVIKRMTNLSL
jgi:hypothetical protein